MQRDDHNGTIRLWPQGNRRRKACKTGKTPPARKPEPRAKRLRLKPLWYRGDPKTIPAAQPRFEDEFPVAATWRVIVSKIPNRRGMVPRPVCHNVRQRHTVVVLCKQHVAPPLRAACIFNRGILLWL